MDTRKQVLLRIQQLCKLHGCDINSLARKVDIPSATLKHILYSSNRNPGIMIIKSVCDGFGISLYDFFNTDAFKSTESEDSSDYHD